MSKTMKMKVLILAGCMFLSAVLVMGQQSEVRSIGTFKGVKSAEGINVYLKKGDKESVKVESNKDLSDVVTEISGSYLRIHIRDNHNSWGGSKGRSVKVYVTYVEIDKIAASSASNIFSEGTIKAGAMEIHASSAANIEVSVDATDVDVHASSAGDIVLEGKATSINTEASSAGEIDAYNLQAENAEASASSAGSIKISVSKGINAHASSGGSIRYRGNPGKTNTNSSSGGSVTRSN
jgi:Putative auto-transporter adhesin, head GIN domain